MAYGGDTYSRIRMVQEVRKIQLTGGATYIVSLPKQWARSVGLQRGDEVVIIQQPDNSLLLIPKKVLQRGDGECTITVGEDIKPKRVARLIIGHYVAGYNTIRVKFVKPNVAVRRAVKDVVRRKIIGAEIISESNEEMVIQCITDYREIGVKRIIERMAVIAKSMFTDAIDILKSRSADAARDIRERDDEADRFYWLAVRQLKRAVSNRAHLIELGLLDAREALGMRIIAKSIERIADHAVRIAVNAAMLEEEVPSMLLSDILGFARHATKVFDTAIEAFRTYDEGLAQLVMDEAEEMWDIERSILEKISRLGIKPKDAGALRLVLDSIKRVGDYSADIGEIVLHLNIEQKQLVTSSSK